MDDEKPRDLTGLNTDELLEALQLDELADAPLIKPVNYAKLYADMTPQKVYYHIRRGNLNVVRCPCGSKCIKKDAADRLFKKGEYDESIHGQSEAGTVGNLPSEGQSVHWVHV